MAGGGMPPRAKPPPPRKALRLPIPPGRGEGAVAHAEPSWPSRPAKA